MDYHEDHMGHRIDIHVSERRKDEFTWSYTIDGEHYTELRERPLPSENTAHREALRDAQFRIDGGKKS
jgi:hypothetical protein